MPSKEFIHKMLNGHCAYCGKKVSLEKVTRDHVVPKSKGGGNTVENILPSCKKCNGSKGDMNLEEFRKAYFKDRPHPERERFYFERVFAKQVNDTYKSSTEKARTATSRYLSEEQQRKMDTEPSYRAMMKILGLLALAHEQLRIAVENYRCWDWNTPVRNMEEDYQMILAMADNYGRVRNLFLDLVETRYGTRSFISLERPYIDSFPDNGILAEIDKLEKTTSSQKEN